MPKTIDFVMLPGFSIDAVYTNARPFDTTKFPQQNAPEKGLTGFGLINAVVTDLTGGRFGWVSFGVKVGTQLFFEKPHPINYVRQIFRPVEIVPTCLRIFLAPGTNIDFSVSPVGDILKDIKKLEDIVLPLISAKAPVGIGAKLPLLIK